MAQAKKEIKKVARTVYDESEVVTLELSKEEAIFLKACMTKVGGDPGGLRGIADNIAIALHPIVGNRFFTNDAWFKNEYFKSGERCGYSFDSNTSVDTHITKGLSDRWSL